MEFNQYERRQADKSIRSLSDQAKAVYQYADMLEIYQRADKFYVRGTFEGDDMTFAELDEFFCQIGDALGIR